jgi:hypothetical protein
MVTPNVHLAILLSTVELYLPVEHKHGKLFLLTPCIRTTYPTLSLGINHSTIIGSDAIRFMAHLLSCLDVPLVTSHLALTPRLMVLVSDFPARTHLDSNCLSTNAGNVSSNRLAPRLVQQQARHALRAAASSARLRSSSTTVACSASTTN